MEAWVSRLWALTQELPVSSIKIIIETYFNRHATLKDVLFSRITPTFSSKSSQICEGDILATVCFCAPREAVYELLAALALLPGESLAGLLSKHTVFERSVVYALLFHYPDLVTQTMSLLASLNSVQLAAVFAGKTRDFTHWQLDSILSSLKDNVATSLVSVLKRLDKSDARVLFLAKGAFAFGGMPVLVTLFDNNRLSENMAVALLEWVQQFDNDTLLAILHGWATPWRSSENRSLVHVVMEFYPLPVNLALMQCLIERFDALMVMTLLMRAYWLSSSDKYNAQKSVSWTGLQYIFAAWRTPSAAPVIGKMLMDNPSLRPLFIKQVKSLWLTAVQYNNYPGMIFFLINFPEMNLSKEAFSSLVISPYYNETVSILSAHEWYLHYRDTTVPQLEIIKKLPKINNEIRQVGWQNNQSLLALAAGEKKEGWVFWLLANQWPRMQKDDAGLLPLHRAIASGDVATIKPFMANIKEDWITPDDKGRPPLAGLLLHTSLLESWFSYYQAPVRQCQGLPSIRQTVAFLTVSSVQQEALLQVFEKDEKTQSSWLSYFHQAALTHNLGVSYVLSQAGWFYGQESEAQGLADSLVLVKKLTETMHQQPALFEVSRINLAIFLLSLPVERWLRLQSSLTEIDRPLTESALLYGITRAAVYRRLSHQVWVNYIDSLPASAQCILAQTVLLSGQLAELSIPSLIYLSDKLSFDALFTLTTQRNEMILLIMTINKAPCESARTETLQRQLQDVIEKGALTPFALETLYRVLALTRSKQRYEFISHLLDTPTQPLQQAIEVLLQHFLPSFEVPAESFLHQVIMTRLTETAFLSEGLSYFIANLEIKEAKSVIEAQKAYVQKELAMDKQGPGHVGLLTDLSQRVSIIAAGIRRNKAGASLWLCALDLFLMTGYELGAFDATAPAMEEFERQLRALWRLYEMASPLMTALMRLPADTTSTALFAVIDGVNPSTRDAFIQYAEVLGEDGLVTLMSGQSLSVMKDLIPWQERRLMALKHSASVLMMAQLTCLMQKTSTTGNVLDKMMRLFLIEPLILNEVMLSQLITFLIPYLDLATSEQCLDVFSCLFESQPIDSIEKALSRLHSDKWTCLLKAFLCDCHSEHLDRRASASQLLTRCLYAIQDNPVPMALIKTMLNAEDLPLLNEPMTQALMREILQDKSSLIALTFDGVWILRLLVSPVFVASITEGLMGQLIERFRLIALTLKHEEYRQLTKVLQGELSVTMQRLMSAETRQRLLAKRARLLQFRADDTVREVLNRLEAQALLEESPKALSTLYGYLAEQLKGFRDDALFRLTNRLYQFIHRGDLDATSKIRSWLLQYCPHDNFLAEELKRKQERTLYDNKGQIIGLLDESNRVMQLEQDELRELIVDYPVETPLFNRDGTLIGHLTYHSQFKPLNVFQEETSAKLLAGAPTEVLMQSLVAVKLLLQDVLSQGTLTTLYNQEAITDTHRHWLTEQMRDVLITTQLLLQPEAVRQWLAQGGDGALVLEKMGHAHNAYVMLQAILQDPSARGKLFNKDKHCLQAYLARHDGVSIVTDLLIHYHDYPWFLNLLRVVLEKNPDRLRQSLEHLCLRIESNNIKIGLGDAILQALIQSELHVDWLLHDVLRLDSTSLIQDISAPDALAVLAYFGKIHIKPLMQSLVSEQALQHTSRYWFLLLILHLNFNQLFLDEEVRYARKLAWFSEDLQALRPLVVRHLKAAPFFDKALMLGHALWVQLVFRGANFGQVGMFYDANHRLDASLVSVAVEKSALARMQPSPSFLSSVVEPVIQSVVGLLPSKRNEEEHKKDFLRKNQAIIDWNGLRSFTYSALGQHSPAALMVFLLNYSGRKAPFMQLLNDVFLNASDMPQISQQCTHLMNQFPKKEVSIAIFEALEKQLRQNPAQLTSELLSNMAQFYQSQINKSPKDELKMQLALIHYWGQNQCYDLVHQACRLLPVKGRDELGKQVAKIALEAKVEGALNASKGRYFFRLIAAIKRLWHYGFKGYKTPSMFVSYCDNKREEKINVMAPDDIRATELGGQTIERQLAYLDKMKALQKRVDTFLANHPKLTLT